MNSCNKITKLQITTSGQRNTFTQLRKNGYDAHIHEINLVSTLRRLGLRLNLGGKCTVNFGEDIQNITEHNPHLQLILLLLEIFVSFQNWPEV